jgi:mono/diheme cytochrome c family protein
VKRLVVILAVLVVAAVVAGAAGFVIARQPEIAPVARPAPNSFDRALVARGEKLAAIGNCNDCHTRTGGRPFAGGLAMVTPFGTIHSTNITPDVETGIGAWSEAAFIRAMREGVNRAGQHLYPAFPYDYFARVNDADLKAIYAFLMTRAPVSQKPTENTLPFPFNNRMLLAGWKMLFHDATPIKADPTKDEEWNRGAYLVESLGHCGACHTPRNVFGAAPKAGSQAYAGAPNKGWYAPALNADALGLVPWTAKAMVNYLIDGWDAHHGIASGPMTPVVNNLADAPEDDVFAMAAYLTTVRGGALPPARQDAATTEALAFANRVEWGSNDAPPIPSDPVMQRGARVFEAQCATCHKVGGKSAPLALTTAVTVPDASNLIAVTLHGIKPPRGSLDRSMPARALQINDEEMAALAAFVRARFTKLPAWTGLVELSAKVRKEGAN